MSVPQTGGSAGDRGATLQMTRKGQVGGALESWFFSVGFLGFFLA